MINSLHVPEDAGGHHDALVGMLRRIPDNWGRWISCGPGWYPLITRLDEDLSVLDPDYEIHQVKEKFGTLCYYATTQIEDEEAHERFAAFISDAERQSATICERCGKPGQLCAMGANRRWYKTLCRACTAAITGESGRRYVPVEQGSDDE